MKNAKWVNLLIYLSEKCWQKVPKFPSAFLFPFSTPLSEPFAQSMCKMISLRGFTLIFTDNLSMTTFEQRKSLSNHSFLESDSKLTLGAGLAIRGNKMCSKSLRWFRYLSRQECRGKNLNTPFVSLRP